MMYDSHTMQFPHFLGSNSRVWMCVQNCANTTTVKAWNTLITPKPDPLPTSSHVAPPAPAHARVYFLPPRICLSSNTHQIRCYGCLEASDTRRPFTSVSPNFLKQAEVQERPHGASLPGHDVSKLRPQHARFSTFIKCLHLPCTTKNQETERFHHTC